MNDAAQSRRHAARELRRRVSQDRGRQLRVGRGGKGETARDQFIEEDAQGPNVTAEGLPFAEQEFRRHVGEGPRNRRHGCPGARTLFIRVTRHLTGEAEVEDLQPPLSRNDDVCALEVAVDDAMVVSVRDGRSDLDAVRQDGRRRQAVSGDALLQKTAGDELHHDVRSTIQLEHLVDGADVGVVEPRGRACLVQQLADRRVIGARGSDELDRDVAIELDVVGLVDFAHPSRSERSRDLVPADPTARREHHHCESVGELSSRPRGHSAERRRNEREVSFPGCYLDLLGCAVQERDVFQQLTPEMLMAAFVLPPIVMAFLVCRRLVGHESASLRSDQRGGQRRLLVENAGLVRKDAVVAGVQ